MALGAAARIAEAAADLLRATRPTAVEPRLGGRPGRWRAGDRSLELARELHREQDEADRRLAELGAARFEAGDRALTHCNAGALATAGYGTAGGVLHAAWEHGLPGAGVGGRDAPAPPGRAPDRLGARAGRHPPPAS